MQSCSDAVSLLCTAQPTRWHSAVGAYAEQGKKGNDASASRVACIHASCVVSPGRYRMAFRPCPTVVQVVALKVATRRGFPDQSANPPPLCAVPAVLVLRWLIDLGNEPLSIGEDTKARSVPAWLSLNPSLRALLSGAQVVSQLAAWAEVPRRPGRSRRSLDQGIHGRIQTNGGVRRHKAAPERYHFADVGLEPPTSSFRIQHNGDGLWMGESSSESH